MLKKKCYTAFFSWLYTVLRLRKMILHFSQVYFKHRLQPSLYKDLETFKDQQQS